MRTIVEICFVAEQLKDLKPGVVGSLHAHCSLTAVEVVSRKLGPVPPMCTPRVVAVVLWLRHSKKHNTERPGHTRITWYAIVQC